MNYNNNILDRIEELISEELLLFAKYELTETESKRLNEIELEMAQCWIQLHRRRTQIDSAEYQENIKSDINTLKRIKS